MVAVVVQTDTTEAIPLLDDNGSGVYNKGRNNIDDFRKYFVGALFGKSASNPFANRNGLIAVTADSAGTYTDGLVATTGGAGTQAVLVAPFRALVNRTGRGPSIVIQDTTIQVNAPAADTLARRDLLCVMPYDKGAFGSDATHGPKFIWVTGDPNASPTTPALPAAVADAFVIALVSRPANDNTIANADITRLAVSAGMHGVPRPLLGADLLTDAGLYHGEIRALNKDYINQISPAALARGHTMWFDYWDAPSTSWKGMNRPVLVDTKTATSNGTLNAVTEQMDTGTSITFNATINQKYKVTYGVGHSSGADGNRIECSPRFAAGAAVAITDALLYTGARRVFRSDTKFNWDEFHCWWTAPSTAQYTIGIGLKVYDGTSATVYSTAEPEGNSRLLTIENGEN